MAMAAVLLGGVTALAQGQRIYKVGVVPWAGFSPMHVAQEKGFWSSRGIQVKVINFASTQESQQAIREKRIDLSCDMAGTVVGLSMAKGLSTATELGFGLATATTSGWFRSAFAMSSPPYRSYTLAYHSIGPLASAQMSAGKCMLVSEPAWSTTRTEENASPPACRW